MPTRVLVIVAAFMVAAAGLVAMSGTAHAAAYRYWTYWQGGTGTWTFATAGPAAVIPLDGSVEGWRFAVTTTAGLATDAPSTDPSFDTICAATPAQADRKRVALVIDPGIAAAAPEGQIPPPETKTCIVAELDATGYQVLRAATTVRTDGGLICAIDDYPTGECAPVVDDPPSATDASAATPPTATTSAMAAQETTDASSGPAWPTAAVVALLAIVGILWWRRRHD